MTDICPVCQKNMEGEKRYSAARKDGNIVFICHTHKADTLPANVTILYTDLGERQHFMKNGGYAPYNNSFA